ncbi:MAG TPA: hypothetical protein VNB22_20995 [Pyrinomonadaceae bacterium]|nr:hypothetical protein [Pyrinomonadaceae bacterium]
MKRFPLKLMFAVLTFFIGLGAVGIWYFSNIESASRKNLSEAISIVTPVKSTFENPCDGPRPSNREIEAEEAVYLAECFIIQNGYTDLPPIDDKSKLTPENLFPGTDEEGMKMRRDSLERIAYSYERDNELYGGRWIVMFRYKPHPEVVRFYGDSFDHIGRAVIIDFYGKRLRVQHSDYLLKSSETILINR